MNTSNELVPAGSGHSPEESGGQLIKTDRRGRIRVSRKYRERLLDGFSEQSHDLRFIGAEAPQTAHCVSVRPNRYRKIRLGDWKSDG